MKNTVIRLREDYNLYRPLVGLCSQQTWWALPLLEKVFEIMENVLFSWLRSVWPWMKVTVNIINTWCILMSEAVTVPSWMMTSTVAEELLARDRHTYTHTDRHSLIYINCFKVLFLRDFENRNKMRQTWVLLSLSYLSVCPSPSVSLRKNLCWIVFMDFVLNFHELRTCSFLILHQQKGKQFPMNCKVIKKKC